MILDWRDLKAGYVMGCHCSVMTSVTLKAFYMDSLLVDDIRQTDRGMGSGDIQAQKASENELDSQGLG